MIGLKKKKMNNMEELPEGVKKRSRSKYIPFNDADPDKIVVSLCVYQDSLYCATQKGVYILEDEQFERLELKEKRNGI